MEDFEKMAYLESAIQEYKKAIAHSERCIKLMDKIGVSLCHAFYSDVGSDKYNVHVFEGFENLADVTKTDVAVSERFDTQYPVMVSTDYDGLHFFEIRNEGNVKSA